MRSTSTSNLLNGSEMRSKKVAIFAFFVIFSFIYLIWRMFIIQSDIEKLNIVSKHKIPIELCNEQIMNLKQVVRMTATLSLPKVYAITPTYKRYVQKAELTRISQTLLLVPHVHWIIVEDSDEKTELVSNLLSELSSSLTFTHLVAKTPPDEKLRANDPKWKKHRGVEQRNTALNWIRSNLKVGRDIGVVYFMDDDNTYSVKIFEEMAKIKRVGVWPVGLVGGLSAEVPLLDASGKVKGYQSGWKPNRPFAIDMAGFAINLDLILTKPEGVFSYNMEHGYQESQFLSYFTTKEELEPLADNCTKVYVWHTRTETPKVISVIKGLEV